MLGHVANALISVFSVFTSVNFICIPHFRHKHTHRRFPLAYHFPTKGSYSTVAVVNLAMTAECKYPRLYLSILSRVLKRPCHNASVCYLPLFRHYPNVVFAVYIAEARRNHQQPLFPSHPATCTLSNADRQTEVAKH